MKNALPPKQFFTLADLTALGLTHSNISRLLKNGTLVHYNSRLFRNTAFQQDSDAAPVAPLAAPPFTLGMCPVMMLDLDGTRRSVVHYVMPEQPDALQLVQIGVQTTEPGYSFGPTVRDYETSHFVLEGCGKVTINGESFPAKAGQIFHLSAGNMMSYESDREKPWRYMWIGFYGAWSSQLLSGIGLGKERVLSDIMDMEAVEELFEQLPQAMSRDVSYISMMPFFWRIVQELMKGRGYAPNRIRKTSDWKKNDSDGRVAEVLARIERDYMNELSVTRLAEEMDMSRAWLSRCFKKTTGKTIVEYITDLRISHAKDLLLQTPYSIGEIAFACGYRDVLFFSRVFRKKTGLSPRQWRNGGYRNEKE